MNPYAVLALLAGLSALAVTVMLWFRRRAPEGGYFTDSDRASGVLGLIGTSYAVLLAFVIFLAFESFNSGRAASSQEAVAVRELARTATLFADPERDKMSGELLCYARAVTDDEWRLMAGEGGESVLVNRWLEDLQATLRQVRLPTPREEVALGHFLDQFGERQQGRRARLAEAPPFVPPVVWVVLLVGGLLIIVYVGGYADPRERRVVQALMMTGAVTTVVSGLLIVLFLDRPYQEGAGSIRPTVMQNTAVYIERQIAQLGGAPVPCDSDGRPAPTP